MNEIFFLAFRVPDVIADDKLQRRASRRRCGLQRQVPPVAGEAADHRDEGEERHRKYDSIDLAELPEPRQEAAGGSVHDARRQQSQDRVPQAEDLEGQTESPAESGKLDRRFDE